MRHACGRYSLTQLRPERLPRAGADHHAGAHRCVPRSSARRIASRSACSTRRHSPSPASHDCWLTISQKTQPQDLPTRREDRREQEALADQRPGAQSDRHAPNQSPARDIAADQEPKPPQGPAGARGDPRALQDRDRRPRSGPQGAHSDARNESCANNSAPSPAAHRICASAPSRPQTTRRHLHVGSRPPAWLSQIGGITPSHIDGIPVSHERDTAGQCGVSLM